jgi:hypothetical protein
MGLDCNPTPERAIQKKIEALTMFSYVQKLKIQVRRNQFLSISQINLTRRFYESEEALWEKGDFTRIAESMRECQPTQLMQKGERMKISIFLRRRATKRDDSTTGAVADLIRGVSESSFRPVAIFPSDHWCP